MGIPQATRHDPAATENLAAPFTVGATDVGMTKGSQAQYKREVRDVSLGSVNGQPVLRGQYPHPIPPPKGDRW